MTAPNNNDQVLFTNGLFSIKVSCGPNNEGLNLYLERVGQTVVSFDGLFISNIAEFGIEGNLLDGSPAAESLYTTANDDLRATAQGTIAIPATQSVFLYNVTVSKQDALCFMRGGVTPTV